MAGTTAAKRGAAAKAAEADADAEAPAAEPTRAEAARQKLDDQYVSYRDDAATLWDADEEGKAGTLTHKLFRQLEPLLFKPTPPAYIETLPVVQGKPFVSTGLKSTQIQYDRMNDVLGSNHWRIVFFYTQQATVCKAIGIVGNDLHWARVDDAGNLLPYTIVGEGENQEIKYADIIAVREGWGGWKSRTVGDTFKASETNATKRMLSRFGPGSDVYRGELEDDVLTALKGEEAQEQTWNQAAQGNAARQVRGPRQQQRAPQQSQRPLVDAQQEAREASQASAEAAPPPAPTAPPEITEEQAQKNIDELLEIEDVLAEEGKDPIDLQAMRKELNAAMLSLPEDSRPSAIARWTLIAPRKDDPRQMADLITRAKNASG